MGDDGKDEAHQTFAAAETEAAVEAATEAVDSTETPDAAAPDEAATSTDAPVSAEMTDPSTASAAADWVTRSEAPELTPSASIGPAAEEWDFPPESQPAAELEPGADATADPGTTTVPHPDGDRADHVDLRQGNAANIEATTVTVAQSGVSRINARDVTVTQSGVGLVRTDLLKVEDGASAGLVMARRAQLSPGSRVMVLITRGASGDVQPTLDWRGALAVVVGYLVFRHLVGRLLRR